MTLDFSRQIFEKSSDTKFHENPSNGSRVVPRGRTDITKLDVFLTVHHELTILITNFCALIIIVYS